MQPRRLTDRISVAPQIAADDLTTAVAQGFKSVINNRPDGEAPDQPSDAALRAQAEQLGLAWRHIPIVTAQLSSNDIESFGSALEQLEGPVLAFCRSGTRSTLLWALAEAGRRPLDEILATAARAGYDLSTLRPQLEGWAARRAG